LDLAKLMLVKIHLPADLNSPVLTEKLSDLLFEIGKDLLKRQSWAEAVHWLERSYDTLSDEKHAEALSSDAGELKISIVHSMVKALLNMGGSGNREKAWNYVRQLEMDCGDRFLVLLLKLDLYSNEPSPSPQDYCDVLKRVVGVVHVTASNVKTVLHHVHQLRAWSPTLAHSILVTFLSERLLGSDECTLCEKALITIIWNGTTATDVPDFMGSLEMVLDCFATDPSKSLSPSATHAAQMVCNLDFSPSRVSSRGFC